MKPAAIAACAVFLALAAPSPAIAQGVGLRAGSARLGVDPGWGITPAMSAPVGYALDQTTERPSGAGGLSGLVDPNVRLAPYLGIGYGNVPGAGVKVYFDLGVIYRDAADAVDPAAERYSLERSLNRYNLSPVGRVGIRLGF
jgi:hypothetical protein